MGELCVKCKVKLKPVFITCSGLCGQVLHPSCAKVPEEDCRIIQKSANIKWYCDGCLPYVQFNLATNHELHQVKQMMVEKMSVLENIVRDKVASGPEKSYASIAAGEVVVIKPKTIQDSKTTKEAIKKSFDPAKLEVGITEMKELKQGGVMIKCQSRHEIEKIRNVAEKKLKRNYEIKSPEHKNPKVKIVGIEENYDKDTLEEVIRKQNTYLKECHLDIKVIKKMKTRYMAIIECNPESFQLLIKNGKLSIGWSICRIYEYVSVLRCFKCGNFDHRASECQAEERCLRCSQVSHKTDECENAFYKCCNCLTANEKLKLNLNVDHNIFDVNCPVYLKKVEAKKEIFK